MRRDARAATPAHDSTPGRRRARLTRRGDLTPDERFERSARFWARAYPRRWRETHGDELLAVQQDVALAVAEATGAAVPDRVDADEVRALLVAGWGLRWRERPPLWRVVLYRFGLRLPARYWWWVADDIRGALYSVRDALWAVGLIYGSTTGGLAVYAAAVGRPFADVMPDIFVTWFFWGVVGAVVLAAATFQREYRTRTAWYRHVVYGNVPEHMLPAAVPPDA
ncbi:hypothetical protein [Oerskovia turbata]